MLASATATAVACIAPRSWRPAHFLIKIVHNFSWRPAHFFPLYSIRAYDALSRDEGCGRPTAAALWQSSLGSLKLILGNQIHYPILCIITGFLSYCWNHFHVLPIRWLICCAARRLLATQSHRDVTALSWWIYIGGYSALGIVGREAVFQRLLRRLPWHPSFIDNLLRIFI